MRDLIEAIEEYSLTDERLERARRMGFDTSRIWYHGTASVIHAFDNSFLGRGNDQFGSGFYFTSTPEGAEGWAGRAYVNQPVAKRTAGPTIHAVYLRMKKNVYGVKRSLTYLQIEKLMRASPNFEDALTNFGDIGHLGFADVLRRAVFLYADKDAYTAMNYLANDFWKDEEGKFVLAFKKITGYDHCYLRDNDSSNTCVMFDPQDIKSTHAAFNREGTNLLESTDKTLYHGTLITNVADIKRYGLWPAAGDFTKHFYADEQEDDLDDLVFAADKTGLHGCISVIIGQMRVKNIPVSPENFRRYGALIIMKNHEHRFEQRPQDEERYQSDWPRQVEPGDYYTEYSVKNPDIILTGKKMISYFAAVLGKKALEDGQVLPRRPF